MSKRDEGKHRHEVELVREFLKHCRTPVGKDSISGGDKPDVRLSLTSGGRLRRVGVEVTEYQSDARRPEGSLGCRYEKFQLQVFNAWVEHFKTREPPGCWVTLRFEGRPWPGRGDAASLVRELDRFAQKHRGRTRTEFSRKRLVQNGFRAEVTNDFAGYTKMEQFVERISLYATGGLTLSDTGIVSLYPRKVQAVVTRKGAQCKEYDRSNLDELWLLICAGATLGSHAAAGPRRMGEQLARDPELKKAVASSGFDRVIFWERCHQWPIDIPGAGNCSGGALGSERQAAGP